LVIALIGVGVLVAERLPVDAYPDRVAPDGRR